MAAVRRKAQQTTELSSLLTDPTFEELSLSEYKRKLRSGLEHLLDTCRLFPIDHEDKGHSDSAVLVKYDPPLLRRSLYAAVPWERLCRKYDECHSGTATSGVVHPDDQLTVVLQSLLNPIIWPSCCAQTVLECLLEVWILQLNNRNTPSRRYLFDEIITNQLFRRNPSLRTNVGPFLSGLISHLDAVDPAGKALLSLLQRWCTEFPVHRALWLTLLLELLARCERLEHDFRIRQENHQHQQRRRQRQQQQQTSALSVTKNRFDPDSVTRSRQSRSAGFSMQCLHGEFSEEEEEALAKTVARKKRRPHSSVPPRTVNIGFKDLLKDSTADDLIGNPGDLLLSLWKFRAKCVRALLLLCRTTVRAWSTGGGIPRCPKPVGTVIQLVLKVAEQVPYTSSASIRLCATLLAQTDAVVDEKAQAGVKNDALFFEAFLGYVWSKALSLPGDNVSLFYFRFAVELLSECSHFDNLERLQRAVCPLFQHIHTVTTASLLLSSCGESNKRSNTSAELGNVTPLLRCFAYLLSRRGTMLLVDWKTKSPSDGDGFHRGFTALLKHLSVSFGRASDWVDPSDLSAERDNIVHALQAAGILGMSVVDGDARNKDKCSISARNSNIRIAASRMEAWMNVPFFSESPVRTGKKWTPIFSPFSPNNALTPSALVARDAARSMKRGSRQNLSPDSASMDDLDDNLLQNVFSFLNYKRVTLMRTVCSTWKENADANRLWQFLYGNKYCICPDDPVRQIAKERVHAQDPSTYIDWRKIFADRWHAGREIRFRYARTDPTWKVRICNYVGCLHVLSSPSQLKQHYESHRKGRTKQHYKTHRQKQMKKHDKSHRKQQTKKRKPPKNVGRGSKKRICSSTAKKGEGGRKEDADYNG